MSPGSPGAINLQGLQAMKKLGPGCAQVTKVEFDFD